MTTTQPRRVALFGGSGKIGRRVLGQLLEAGHDVAAYVRNPAKLDVAHLNLTVVSGELHDAAAIANAIEGTDAVISALGPTLKRSATGTPVSEGTRDIVAGMQAAGVRRYIGLATPAMADQRDRPTLKGKARPSSRASQPRSSPREVSPRTRRWPLRRDTPIMALHDALRTMIDGRYATCCRSKPVPLVWSAASRRLGVNSNGPPGPVGCGRGAARMPR